jgi:alpha-ketoglutarate-dependent taurine dioxygenase
MSNYEAMDLGEQGWQVLDFPELAEDPSGVKDKVLEIAAAIGSITVHGDYPGAMPIRLVPGAKESYYATPIPTPLHSDMAWWPGIPPKYIVMGCERPAEDGGGVSRHVDAWGTFRALPDETRELLITNPVKIPAAPHHVRSASMVDFGDKQGVIRPSASLRSNGEPIIRLNPDDKFFALNSDQPPELIAAIQQWKELNETGAESMLMSAGQVVVLDNHRVAHARTSFEDPDRLMWRSYSNPY